MAYNNSSMGRTVRAVCADCRHPNKLSSFCASCGCSFCDTCWEIQPAHRHDLARPGQSRHLKANQGRWEKLQEILEPTTDTRQVEALHRDDEETKWFGVRKDRHGRSKFEDTGRYASLMVESGRYGASNRFPQLVSFIGETSEWLLLETNAADCTSRCWQEHPRQDADLPRRSRG